MGILAVELGTSRWLLRSQRVIRHSNGGCGNKLLHLFSKGDQIRSTAMETISHTHQCELVSNPAKKQIQDDCDQIVPNIDEATEQPPLII
uniref:Uncharacterized protein n=1 Tax=Romanomermis culicivorax TaxID=13658 RepID=A0A915L037_ROMCU